LADYANVAQDGKLNILGVFQEVNPAGFPAGVPQMFLVVSFEASAAEFGTQKHIRIALLEADGTEIMSMEGPIVVQHPPRPGSRAYINQIVNLQGLAFPHAGDYAFHILVGGEEKRAVPLRVNELPSEGTKVMKEEQMAEQITEQTAQVVSNKLKFNGNVARVSSTIVAANAEAGVKAQTFTGAVQPQGEDEAFLAQLKEYHGRRFSDEW
jgi:hypothetical protein